MCSPEQVCNEVFSQYFCIFLLLKTDCVWLRTCQPLSIRVECFSFWGLSSRWGPESESIWPSPSPSPSPSPESVNTCPPDPLSDHQCLSWSSELSTSARSRSLATTVLNQNGPRSQRSGQPWSKKVGLVQVRRLNSHLPTTWRMLPEDFSQAGDTLVIGRIAVKDCILKIDNTHNEICFSVIEMRFLFTLRASDGCPGPVVHLTLINFQNPWKLSRFGQNLEDFCQPGSNQFECPAERRSSCCSDSWRQLQLRRRHPHQRCRCSRRSGGLPSSSCRRPTKLDCSQAEPPPSRERGFPTLEELLGEDAICLF